MTTQRYPHGPIAQPIPALSPRDATGCQFLIYGDCCSGVPGAAHEATFAAVNAVVSRLWPAPEFICFLGDEISGLTADYAALRAQWRHWFEHEMAWLDREQIPLYHTTSNHVTYDEPSEQVFREQLAHLPRNGPRGQEGLSYFIRREHLLMVFINTSPSALGGDGWVETAWLEQTLTQHADATYKLVLGHQPIHSVNGYAGARMRDVVTDNGQRLWALFVQHGVLAYVCSHMLAYDVQVHGGVLQLMTAGAGTAHVLPGEYLHCTQCAIDREGLRCQTLDTSAQVRETLAWPLRVEPAEHWRVLTTTASSEVGEDEAARHAWFFAFSGVLSRDTDGRAQTLLSAWQSDQRLTPLWIGICGLERELTVVIAAVEGRSPQIWRGPQLHARSDFAFQLVLHQGMGPGGIMWRPHEHAGWTSLAATSAWGAERLELTQHGHRWSVGHDRADTTRARFRGQDLSVRWHRQAV